MISVGKKFLGGSGNPKEALIREYKVQNQGTIPDLGHLGNHARVAGGGIHSYSVGLGSP